MWLKKGSCDLPEQRDFSRQIIKQYKVCRGVTDNPGFIMLSALAIAFSLSRFILAYNNGLAKTPQMGWNTWNKYGCNIDEALIVGAAKTLAANFSSFGYNCLYAVTLFTCWTLRTFEQMF
jgi:hypothetical protein